MIYKTPSNWSLFFYIEWGDYQLNRQRVTRLILIFLIVIITVLIIGIGGLLIFISVTDVKDLPAYQIFGVQVVDIKDIISGGEEESIEEEEIASPSEFTVLFAGDVLLDDNYAVMSTLKARGEYIQNAFSQNLIDTMNQADVFMVNNEFTFTNRGSALTGKQFTFRANPENIWLYKDMGVDIVSTANNHIYDYGEISLLDTLETLESNGISYVGAGKNLAEAMTPAYYTFGDMTIAIVSATQIEKTYVPDTKGATETTAGVLRCMDTQNLESAIETASQNADFTILYIHWGTENEAEPDTQQLEQDSVYVDAGADLIIGDHSHCLQPIDMINGVPVVYSLGNFWFNSRTLDSCMIEATFDVESKSLKSLQFIPCLQSDCYTTKLEGEEAKRVIDYMNSISTNISIDENGYIYQKMY